MLLRWLLAAAMTPRAVAAGVKAPATLSLPAAVAALADRGPRAVALTLARLEATPASLRRAAVAQAQKAIAERLRAGGLSLSGAPGLAAYDDVLRSLAIEGVFDGQTIYPLAGADYLPARWGRMTAVNWDDHRPIFRRMARLAGRPDLAADLRARFRPVDNLFEPKALRKALPPFPASGRRALLLKHVDGFSPDFQLDLARQGIHDGDASGVLPYARWLKFVFAETLRPGDLVVLLSRDEAARRALRRSGRFARVQAPSPRLRKADRGSILHVDGQALFAPDLVEVWRKSGHPLKK